VQMAAVKQDGLAVRHIKNPDFGVRAAATIRKPTT
jgi:hypothetical protein